jgi:hypothetical protein
MLENFFSIIYVSRGIFPYDIGRGYNNSNIITSKKFVTLATGQML